MSNRQQRVQDLQKALNDYINSEKTRVQNEVKVLQGVLNGRTGGQGIQQISVAVVTAAADADLTKYLEE